MGVTGAVSLAVGLVFFGGPLFWRSEKDGPVGIALVMLLGIALVLGGAYCIVGIRSKRVLLFEDAIELVDLGYRRRLRRDEIAGLRIIPMQHGYCRWVFELHRPERKTVKTRLFYYCKRDAVLCDWLATLPDLDAMDRERAERELLRRPELGRTEEDRRRSLAKARTVAACATVLAAAATVWGFFYPRPYTAAIVTLAAIELTTVALLLAGRGRYVIWDDRNEVRPSLWVPLLSPGMILAIRAFSDFRWIDWQPPLLWALLGAIALAALVVAVDPKQHRRWFIQLVVCVPLFFAHAWGALLIANALLDRSEPDRFRVAVLDKHICPSSKGGPRHHLRLASWGPVPGGDEVTVGRELYQAVEVGGTVCVVLRSGAIGVRWFYVRACDGSGA
jgi:hypothetical protein